GAAEQVSLQQGAVEPLLQRLELVLQEIQLTLDDGVDPGLRLRPSLQPPHLGGELLGPRALAVGEVLEALHLLPVGVGELAEPARLRGGRRRWRRGRDRGDRLRGRRGAAGAKRLGLALEPGHVGQRGGQLAPHHLELLGGAALDLGTGLHQIRSVLLGLALGVQLLARLLQLAAEIGHRALQLLHLAASPLQLRVRSTSRGGGGPDPAVRRGGRMVRGRAASEDEEAQADDEADADEDEEKNHGVPSLSPLACPRACSTPPIASCSSRSSAPSHSSPPPSPRRSSPPCLRRWRPGWSAGCSPCSMRWASSSGLPRSPSERADAPAVRRWCSEACSPRSPRPASS